MIDTSKLRRFTETDWKAYSGATRFTDDTDPYIYEKNIEYWDCGATDFSLIIGREGVDITITSEDSNKVDTFEQTSWLYPREFEDAEEARKFAIKLLDELNVDGPDANVIDIINYLEEDSRFISPIEEG